MEIQITIGTDGSSTVHVASLLYDLWEDHKLYRQEAESIDRNVEPLKYKRLVRAAVLAFFSYFEGVLNTWVSKLDPSIDPAKLEKMTFGEKIEKVRKKIQRGRKDNCWLDVKKVRTIRNTIVHVTPTTNDIQVMETLLDGQFFSDADRFIKWLDKASRRLNYERHPNVPVVVAEIYSK